MRAIPMATSLAWLRLNSDSIPAIGRDFHYVCRGFQAGFAPTHPRLPVGTHRGVDEDCNRNRQDNCQGTSSRQPRLGNQDVGPRRKRPVQGADTLALQQRGDGGLECHFTIRRDHPFTGSGTEKMTGVMRRTRRLECVEPGVRHVQCGNDQTQLTQGGRVREIVLAITRYRRSQRHIGCAGLGKQEIGFGFRSLLIVSGFGVQRQAGAATFQDPARQIDGTLALAPPAEPSWPR